MLPNPYWGRVDIGYDERPLKRKETIPYFSKKLNDAKRENFFYSSAYLDFRQFRKWHVASRPDLAK